MMMKLKLTLYLHFLMIGVVGQCKFKILSLYSNTFNIPINIMFKPNNIFNWNNRL
jgi:hypothetical protein